MGGLFGIGQTEYSVGMFKWELKAKWLCHSEHEDLPTWNSVLETYTATLNGRVIQTYKDKADGPTGRFATRPTAFPMTTTTFAFDAPRANYETKDYKGQVISVDGTWKVTVSDNKNAWATKFRVRFSFPIDNPSNGNGSLDIIESPAEVNK